MEIKLETISQEMVKPSKPTHPHLKSYQLSLFDQFLSFSEYSTPMVLFYAAPRRYNNDKGSSTIITRLKESLSIALSVYYPLAGRVMPQASTINCNDEGVSLVVARAHCSLKSFLSTPNRVELVSRFIPKDDTFIDPARIEVDGLVLLAFKISVFNCGGFAVGCHGITKVIDGTAWAHLFMTWAANAAIGCDSAQVSEFGAPDLTIQTRIFPPVANHYVSSQSGIPPVLQPVEDGSSENIVKMFVFTPASISRLQDKCRSDVVPNPTRIESVTCFLWKHMMAAAATIQSSSSCIARQEMVPTFTAVIHSVNIRPHLRPKLLPTAFGKFVTHAFADSKNDKGGTSSKLCDLVILLRQALTKTRDSEWLNKFQGDDRVEAACELKKTIEEYMPKSYFFTSLRGFDQVDFGSGAPVWIGFSGGRPSSFFKDYILLIHTNGHQIEAWVILNERQMEALESDQEFLTFAIPSDDVRFTFLPKASL